MTRYAGGHADRQGSGSANARAPRVLYSFPHPIGQGGSINNVAANQVLGSARLGVDIRVFCTSVPRGLLDGLHVQQTLALAGRRIPHRSIGVQRAYRYHDWRVARWLERHAGEIDVVHAYPAGCIRTLNTARRLGIMALREAPSPHTASAFEQARRAAASVSVSLPRDHSHFFDEGRLQLEEAEYRAAGAILVPSEYAASTFIERGYAESQIRRHRLGIDLERFPVADRPVPGLEQGLRAIFLGRGEPNKGLHLALEAWRASGASARGTFVICGPPILADYRRFLEPLLADESVHELGYVEDIAAEMGRADILIHPSYTEGSAMATFEAQAVGCVALVSTSSGADTTHMKSGLVHQTEDIGQLAEHIRLLDNDRALLSTLRSASLSRRLELGHGHAAERLAEIYRECAQQSPECAAR